MYGLHDRVGIAASTAYAVTLTVVFVLNFMVLRYWVYRGSRRGVRAGASQFGKTVAISVAFRGGEWLAFSLLYRFVTLDYRLMILGVLVVSFFFKYLAYRVLVFREVTPPQGAATDRSDTRR